MRGLAPVMVGRRILSAEARRPDLRWPLPPRFADRLQGRQIAGMRRRSKYILVALEDEWTWLIHLGMTGRFAITPSNGPPLSPGAFVHTTGTEGGAIPGDGASTAHDHVVLEVEGARIVYNDVRRFGAMDLAPTSELDGHRLLRDLGPEPLSDAFDARALTAALKGKTANIKSALLDQRIVAGLGNIYVCEALWRAGVHPARAAGGLSAGRVSALVDAAKDVLQDAIKAGGSTLRDYRAADGALGYFQHAFAVYGRAGDPCRRDGCGGTVARIVQSGRSSFYCGRCQK